MCESDVSCDNTNVFGAINSVLPQSTQAWSWENSSGSPNCWRWVTCNGNQVKQKSPLSYYTSCQNGFIYIVCQNNVQVVYSNCAQETENRKEVTTKIDVYPNPSQGVLNFNNLEKGKIYQVEVVNTVGKSILFTKINENQIDIQQLPPGIYFFKIIANQEKVYSSKFIKI
ncbi:MAG: T9SS type A sorting domain-containing protein [Saprospiraceae bacterium]|nr:T9SS type A sorting domain-containing protein [Saprospiraceae bacterium]